MSCVLPEGAGGDFERVCWILCESSNADCTGDTAGVGRAPKWKWVDPSESDGQKARSTVRLIVARQHQNPTQRIVPTRDFLGAGWIIE